MIFRLGVKRLVRTAIVRASRLFVPPIKTKVVHTVINGYNLLVLANENVGREIVFYGNFEPAETACLARAIRPEDTCFDVGANVGYFTLLMAQLAFNGRVHAFEPLALNVALIQASLELSGYSNVVVSQIAVGDRSGLVSFSQSADSAFSSLRDTGRKPVKRQISVPMTSLDEYVQDNSVNRVDILKVDVEGAEALVVSGSTKLLRDAERRPRLIMLELSSKNLQAFKTSVQSVLDQMAGLAYAPYVSTADGQLSPLDRIALGHSENLFFAPTQ